MAATDEIRPLNRLRIAILILVVATGIAVVSGIVVAPWISTISSRELSTFVALAVFGSAAWVISQPPTTKSIRFTPDDLEIADPTGATRRVARERVASMGTEGARVVAGIVVRSRLINGNPARLVAQDRHGVVLARSITWFRRATLEDFAARHGVVWRGVRDDGTPIPIGSPTDWPSAVTPPPPTIATDDPVTVDLVERVRRRTTLYGRLVLLGWGLVILATWWPMSDHYIGVSDLCAMLLIVGAGTWLHRRIDQKSLAATLEVRAWTAIEALVTDGSAEHRTGRYVRFLDPRTGTLGAPFVLQIGKRVPWLIPTQRVWLLCAPTYAARTFWVAPADRSGITVVTLAPNGSLFFRRTPWITA